MTDTSTPSATATPADIDHVADEAPGAADGDASDASADVPIEAPTATPAPTDDAVDLDAVARELDAVQAALDRLNDGTYWTDEVTGEPLPDEVLAANPTARTATDA